MIHSKYTYISQALGLNKNIGTGNGPAYLTHYWQTWPEPISKLFLSEAERFLGSFVNSQEFTLNLPLEFDVPFPPPPNPKFSFIDLFAGIGGFRIAFQELSGKCIFSSEWDRNSQITYAANFGEIPFGDITKIEENNIPDHDILIAGFPCQPFSIAGVSKKNSLGRNHGFLDETQGTLFFDLARIINAKRPKAFLLENVKNLKSHDRGRTFQIIEKTLKKLGYYVFDQIIDARHYVPQHRERIYIVGFNSDYFHENLKFEFPDNSNANPLVFNEILESNPNKKYTLSDHLWTYLQNYSLKHKEKGNGFGFGLTNLNGVSRTLSARYYKDGSEILIPQGIAINPRRLTPEECKRLMGYPECFVIKNIGVSETQLYRQFGNSVVVPVVRAIASKIVMVIKGKEIQKSENTRINRSKELTKFWKKEVNKETHILDRKQVDLK